MKVIINTPSFGKFHEDVRESFSEKDIELVYNFPFDRERLLEEVTDADVIIVGLEQIDKEVLHRSKALKLIAKHGVGVDNIDIKAAEEQGIAVTNVPNTNNDAVADLAFGLMLSAARSIVDANNRVKNGEWPRYDGSSVWGKTLGIIGLGAIGKGVAKRAAGFNMNILAYDYGPKTTVEEELNVQRVSLDELLLQSDYISLHVPLTEQTRHMIGREQFEKMKRTAILINTARGGIIDEEALEEALSKQLIRGCALDVYETEPVDPNSKLLSHDNLITTPHMAAYTVEAGYLTSELIIRNINNLAEGKQLKNVVSKVPQ